MAERDPQFGVESLYGQWKDQQRKRNAPTIGPMLVELPSGMKVRAKRPHILVLMREGKIPSILEPMVSELIAKAQEGGEEAVQAHMREAQRADPAGFYVTWIKLLDLVWLEAVCDPTFTMSTSSEGVVPLYDEDGRSLVDDADKEFMFVWSQGVDQTVATFLDRRSRAIASLEAAPAGG